MAISTQIERINASRDTIREKLIELGISGVTSTSKLDALAEAIEGIVNKGAVEVTIMEGTSYTIPAGYHNGSGVVTALTDTEGDQERYQLQTKTVTPTKSSQSVSSDEGYYGLASVTVAAIPAAYQNVSSVTAEAENVLAGKIIVTSDGTVTTGTMVNNGNVAKILDATTVSYTIPAGYHSGGGKVTISLDEKSVTPSESEQVITPTAGKVLSKVTVAKIPQKYGNTEDATIDASKVLAGEVAYGTEDDTNGNPKAVKIEGTMPNQGSKTFSLDTTNTKVTIPEGYYNGTGFASISTETKSATPSTSEQEIKPSSGKVLSKVTVAAIPSSYGNTSDATVTAGDILDGQIAYGKDANGNAIKIEGTMPNNGRVLQTLDTATKSYSIPAGYHDGAGRVSITTETKSATPSKSSQTIKPTTGSVLESVTVEAIPDKYQDVSGVTATAADVLAGEKFVDSDGAVVTGTMANNGTISHLIDGLTETSYTVPAGYTAGGTVSLSNAIELALADI